MHFNGLLLPVFAAAAVAQTFATTPTTTGVATRTTSGTASTSTSTGLVSLVQQLPTCANSCLTSAAAAISCNPANFSCLCSNSANFIASIGLCVITSCSSDDIEKLTTLTTEICAEISSSPNSSDVASASSIVASALGSSGSSTSSSQAVAPRRTDTPALAAIGGAAAVWAAYAM